MSDKVLCEMSDLTAIANAVRSATGSTDTYNVEQLSLAATAAIANGGGNDGFSPTIDVTVIDGGHRVSITDKDGTETFDVMDGQDGNDGFSPTVSVDNISGGHRVSITDKNGTKVFDVMDGKDGEGGGSGGVSVQSDWSVNDESDPAYVKNRTHWMERPYEPISWDGSTDGRDSVDVGPFLGYPAGLAIAYKISDHVLTKDELSISKVDAICARDGKAVVCEIKESYDLVPGAIWYADYADVVYDTDGSTYSTVNEMIICTSVQGDFSASMGIVIPSTGTYILRTDPNFASQSIRISGEDVYHTIDPKFIPPTTGIIDVAELPTKDARKDSLYRLVEGQFYNGDTFLELWRC